VQFSYSCSKIILQIANMNIVANWEGQL